MEQQAQTAGSRIQWIESIRTLAAFWVFVVHYIDVYNPAYFNAWNPGTVLEGLSGKLAMCMFLVLCGYFAAAREVKKRELPAYLVRRYLQMCIPMLLITFTVALYKIIFNGAPVGDMALEVLSSSFLMRYTELCTQAVCLKDFMLCIIIVGVLSGNRFTPALLVVAGLLAYRLRNIWVAIGILGAFVYHAQKLLLRLPAPVKRVIFSRAARAAVLIGAYIAIRRPEGFLTYAIDGIACAAVLLTALWSPLMQRLLSARPLVWLGSFSFEFFLSHIFLFRITHDLISLVFGTALSSTAIFWIAMPISAAVSVAGAYLMRRLLDTKPFRMPFALAGRIDELCK